MSGSVAAGYPNFLGLSDDEADFGTARAVILPVPYDGTSTWHKGADHGPAALLQASTQVELFDIETQSEPWREGIATLPPIEDAASPEEMAARVEREVHKICTAGKMPVVIGGEHSVSLGAINAVAASCGGDLTVLQIDAHGDTRESYHGSTHNHACVMARAREVATITQVGIRAIAAEEYASMDLARVFFAHDIVGSSGRGWIDDVLSTLASKVYITIDLDAFDPSLLPATGTPEPGGLNWQDVIQLVKAVTNSRELVGFDVVELLPSPGQHASEFIAAKLVHRILAMHFAATV
ncbi:MAG: agmatinase [Phycisphaerales bacterium]